MGRAVDYPPILAVELSRMGGKVTHNREQDEFMLHSLRVKAKDPAERMHRVALTVKAYKEGRKIAEGGKLDMSDKVTYNTEANILLALANEMLAPQRRTFVLDANNRPVLRFLMLYFNGSKLAEQVYPNRGYKLHKNIILQGGVGCGKTFLMRLFSRYLQVTRNPMYFQCTSVGEMINSYRLHNNLDAFTYCEDTGGNVQHICLDDIGVENGKVFGVDTTTLVNDFLHARSELWTGVDTEKCFTHLTTNLSEAELTSVFTAKDRYGRTADRFKTFNVIPLAGGSRR